MAQRPSFNLRKICLNYIYFHYPALESSRRIPHNL